MDHGTLFVTLYHEGKFWVPLIGGAWAVFKFLYQTKMKMETGLNSIEEIKTNHIPHLQQAFTDQTLAITKSYEKGTEAIVGELKELRQDFRSRL